MGFHTLFARMLDEDEASQRKKRMDDAAVAKIAEALSDCAYVWITPGDGVHYSDLKHTCILPAGHTEDHTCQCKRTTPSVGMDARAVRNRIVEMVLSRPEVGSFTILVNGTGPVKSFTVNDGDKTIELRSE